MPIRKTRNKSSGYEKAHTTHDEGYKPTEHFHETGGSSESIAEGKWKLEGMIEKSLLKLMEFGSLMKMWGTTETGELKGFEEGSKGHEQVTNAVQAQPHNVMYTAGLSNNSAHQGAPVERAANYLTKIRSGNEDMDSHEHVLGHQAIADIAHNIPRFGNEYATHPDAVKYNYISRTLTPFVRGTSFNLQESPAYPWHPDNGYDGRGTPQLMADQLQRPKSLEQFHGRQSMIKHTSGSSFLTPVKPHSLSNQAYGMMDELHHRIRMESPSYNPDAVIDPLGWPLRGMNRQRELGTDHAFVEHVPLTEEAQERSRELGEGRSSKAHEIFDVDRPGTTGFRWGPRKKGPTSREQWPLSRHGQEVRDIWAEHGIADDASYEDVMAQAQEQDEIQRLGQDEFEWTTPEERTAAYRVEDINRPPPAAPKPAGSQQNEEIANAFQRKFPHLFKEGDGGAAGLGGTVFTSSNAGIFTPTFGGSKVRRIHRKNKRRNDRTRKALMGKDKKNGVDRLVQFLQEGSPRMHKSEPDKMMTGQMQGGSAAGENKTPLKQIDWKKRQDGISKVEPHPTMGMNNGGSKDTPQMQESGTAASYPSVENPTTGAAHVDKARNWGKSHFDMQKASPFQKASPGGQVGIGPPTNQNTMAAIGKHPQAQYTEEVQDKEKKEQVIAQNDFDRKTKKHDNKEDEPSAGQDGRTAMATKSTGDYPDSSMQMMEKEWGSGPDSFAQDDLNREVDDWFPKEEDRPSDTVGNVQSEKKWAEDFKKVHKSFVAKGYVDPLISALLSLDNE